MKSFLNVLADVLTLTAVCIAAIGHVLPWFDQTRVGIPGFEMGIRDIQLEHSAPSGIALGVLAGLVCLSLAFNWGPIMRRLFNLAMFISAFAALLFELMIFSNSMGWGFQRPIQLRDTETGFGLALVPTICAVAISLLRMLWTMPAGRRIRPEQPCPTPPNEIPLKEPGA
jgi:hypothetical protein